LDDGARGLTMDAVVNTALKVELRKKHPQIVALCVKYSVSSLSLFGSATTSEWRSDSSDIDMLVALEPDPRQSIADRFLGLAEDLEELLGRPVDLVTERSVRNPYFRRAIEATRVSLYAA
jgi:uncharacterized protein